MAWIAPTIGLGLQAAGTLADIVNTSIVNQNNKDQLTLQQQLAAQQVEQVKAQMAAFAANADPVRRFERAIAAGFGPEAASQLAGRPTPHMVGGVAVGPMLQTTRDGLRMANLAYGGFTAGGERKIRSKHSLIKDWVESLPPARVPSGPSSLPSRSTRTSWLSNTTRSSTSGMYVTDPGGPRPIITRPGTTLQTWIPGSDA